MNQGSPLSRVAGTSVAALAGKILMVAIVYATYLVLARLYGPELMGTFLIAVNMVTFLGTICTLGLNNGMLRYSALLKENGQIGLVSRLVYKNALVIMGLTLLTAGVIYYYRFWLAEYLNAPDLPKVLLCFAVALPILALTFLLRETLRGLGAVLLATLTAYVAQPAMLLGLILAFYYMVPWLPDLATALSGAFLLSFTGALVILLWGLKKYTPRPQPGLEISLPWKEIWGYSLIVFFSVALQTGLAMLDSLILALFRTPQEVAYYGAAMKMAVFVSLPLIAINAILPPLFVQHHQRGEVRELEYVARSTARWMYYLALPTCLLFLLVPVELLDFFGPGFSKAKWALGVLALGQLASVSAGSVFLLLTLTKNQKTALKVYVSGFSIILPLMALMAAKYGLTGLALAKAFGLALLNGLGAWQVWKTLGVLSFPSEIIQLTLLSLGAFGLIWILHYNYSPPLIWTLLSFVIQYLIIFSLIARRCGDWQLLKAIPRRARG